MLRFQSTERTKRRLQRSQPRPAPLRSFGHSGHRRLIYIYGYIQFCRNNHVLESDLQPTACPEYVLP